MSYSAVLQAALSLAKRPTLHNSTLMLIISLCPAVICGLLNFSRTSYRTVVIYLCCIFTVAWTTHHLRDGLRRGLWIAPFGHTPPIPQWLYLALIAAVPLTVRSLMLVDVTCTEQKQLIVDV